MNIKELQTMLENENVPKRYYLLDGNGIKEDKICLELFNDLWQVYYSERGKKYNLSAFQNESDACNEILQRLRKKQAKQIK